MPIEDAERLIKNILLARLEFRKKHIHNLTLILPKHNFEILKEHYTAVINIPIQSIVLQDKTELPMDKLYGMDIEVRNIEEDFIVERRSI